MLFSFEKSVGAVIFKTDKQGSFAYLLLRYPGGHWGFVKGHVEKEETDEETLRREALEETGISDLDIDFDFIGNEKYFYVARNEERQKRRNVGRGIWIFKKVIYYLAETKTEYIILSQEHSGFVWMKFDQAIVRVTNANSKRVLREANAFLVKKGMR